MWNKISCVIAKSPFISCQFGTVNSIFLLNFASPKQGPIFCTPLLVMVTLPSERNIIELDVKQLISHGAMNTDTIMRKLAIYHLHQTFLMLNYWISKRSILNEQRNNVDQIPWCSNFRMLEEYFLYDIKPSTIFRKVKTLISDPFNRICDFSTSCGTSVMILTFMYAIVPIGRLVT